MRWGLIAMIVYVFILLVALFIDEARTEAEDKKREEERLAAIPDTMPLYNPFSACPKCMTLSPRERYVICGFRESYGYSGEAIQKECRKCGHNWWEHTADFKRETPLKVVNLNEKED